MFSAHHTHLLTARRLLYTLFAFLTLAGTSSAQFIGPYAQENWTFTSSNSMGEMGIGYIDLTNMPTGFTIAGNDEDEDEEEVAFVITSYSITAPEDATMKFRWSYITEDEDVGFDMAAYRLNGSIVSLIDPEGGDVQNGETEVNVSAGDEFAFLIDATDGCCGRGFLTIEAFSTADNTPPTFAFLPDMAIKASPGSITYDVDLEGISAGILETDQSIVITATSSNTFVIPDPIISYTSPEETGTLSFTPIEDRFGDVMITVNVKDNGGTANGSIDNIDVTFIVSMADNLPPEIASIPNVEGRVNQPFNIGLSDISPGVGETTQIISSITASSSDQSVISDDDIKINYTSPSPTGTLAISPIANASGEAIITVTLTDDGTVLNNGKNKTTTFFKVTIVPNAPPTINEVADLNLFANSTEQLVQLTGIADGDGNTQSLALVANSNNTSLIPNPSVTYASPGTTGSLSFTPVAGQFGTATVTITLTDDGDTNNGGIDATTMTFDVHVSGNFPPRINPLGNIFIGINEPDRTVNLSEISAGVVSGSESVTVTASSSNNSVINSEDIMVNYVDPETNGSIVFTPAQDVIGETVITVTATDDGGTANGGINATEESFTVRVVANRQPTIDQSPNLSLDINAPAQTINLSGITAGEDSDYQTINIAASSDNPSFIPNPVVTYASPDDEASLTFTPIADAVGSANITVTVSDNGGILGGGVDSRTMTFEVSVTGNQPPTLDEIDNVSITDLEDFSIELTGISDGTGFEQNLTITATSDNPTIIPNPTIDYTNGEDEGTLDFTPTDFGSATVTVKVRDDGGTDNEGINVFQRSFNIRIGENTPPFLMDFFEDNILGTQTIYVNNGLGDRGKLFYTEDNEENTVVNVNVIGNNNEDLADILTISFTPGIFIGALVFSPEAGQTGLVNFEIAVTDNGGTENNGVNTQVLTIPVVVTEPTTYGGVLPSDGFENHIQPFTVDASGQVYIENLSGDIEASFALYENSFDPQSPGNNLVASGATIAITLEKNTQYILVTTTQDESGSFINAIGVLSGNVSFGNLPNLNFIENVNFDEDEIFNLSLSGISDGNGRSDNLTLSAVSDDVDAFRSFDLTDNQDGTGNLQLSPTPNYNGSATVTVVISGENGSTFDRSFQVTVNSVNDAPTVSAGIADQSFDASFGSATFDLSNVFVDVDESSELTFSGSASATGVVNVEIDDHILTLNELGPGRVNITVIANDGLGGEASDIFEILVNDALGLDDQGIIKVYPNPTPDVLLFDSKEVREIVIFDLNGKAVKRGFALNQIDLSHLKAGMYVIKIKNSNGETLSSNRIIKK